VSTQSIPTLGETVAQTLTPTDFSLLTRNRIVNLQKLFPYIPEALNTIPLHFSAGADIFHETVEELHTDLDTALRELRIV
jgi:hypothetical protein